MNETAPSPAVNGLRGSDLRPLRVVIIAARAAALMLLLISYLAYLGQAFPVASTHADLAKAVRLSHPPTVYLQPENTIGRVSAYWKSSSLTYRKTDFDHSDILDQGAAESATRREVAKSAGVNENAIAFQEEDQNVHSPGVLNFFLLSSFPLLLRSHLLLWVSVIIGAIVLVLGYALPRKYQRVKNRGVWFTACLLTGAGFFAYICLEPLAIGSGRDVQKNPLQARCAWAGSLFAGGILVVVGWLLIRLSIL